MSISWAAVLGAAARLRPILMTSLAMIVGLIPLMLAMGVGAHGNRTLGASAIGWYVNRYDFPDFHRSGIVRGIPVDTGEIQTYGMG